MASLPIKKEKEWEQEKEHYGKVAYSELNYKIAFGSCRDRIH